jgi:outer membrane lipoprotein-sorting protein
MKKLTILLLFISGSLSLLAQDAREIVEKANELSMGLTSRGEMTMTIERPKWTRTVSMKSWSKGTEFYMILITAPARDKGQVFLKRNNDMWNWMPSISRMIKLPPSMMSQSWMGSDFTNDDLVKMNSIVDDYHHRLVGEEKIDGYDCHKIELIPKEDAAVVWGKIDLWIAREGYYQMKAEYFDEDMELVSTMIAGEVTEFNDRKIPAHMEMIPAGKEGHKTIMDLKNMTFNEEIPENFFSQQNMKRVK